MRFLATLSTFALLGLAFAAPIPKDKDKPKKDEDAIQGTWQLDTIDLGGVAPPAGQDLKTIRFTFKEGKLSVSRMGGPDKKEGEYKIDPTTKPKNLDLTESGGRLSPGIYELNGDTLKICIAEGQNPVRPTEFKSNGPQNAVVVFKRVTDEKKDK